MNNEVVPSNPTPVVGSSKDLVNEQYGRYIKRSILCDVCQSARHAEINLMRSRDHMALREISIEVNLHPQHLAKHFAHHFIISESNQNILDIIEKNSPSSREIITKALDGNLDIIEGAGAILKSQAGRLNSIKARLDYLSDQLELTAAEPEEEEIDEFIRLNKTAQDVEIAMLKTYKEIDKKLFPPKKEDLFDAVITYKLDALSKMLDKVALVFIKFQNDPKYTELVEIMREELSLEFNKLEDEIVRSGGILRPSNNV